MRIGCAVRTALLLLTYFTRQAGSRGALRTRPVRILAALGVAIFLVAATGVCYEFLRPYAQDARVWRLVFCLATYSAILWVMAAYLFVKVLLLNAEGMVLLTLHLPITSRERSVSFLIYEAFMVMIVSTFGFAALAAAAVLLVGPLALPQVLASVIVPALTAYLVMSIGYEVMERFLVWARLHRVKDHLLILVMFAAIVAYSLQMARLTAGASAAYWDEAAAPSVFNFAGRLLDSGGIAELLVWSGLLLAPLSWTAVRLAPRSHVRPSRFLPISLGRRASSAIGPYLAFVARSTQTALSATVSIVLFAFLMLRTPLNPVWAVGIMSMIGLYHYANTVTVQRLQPGSGPGTVYARLLASQVIMMAPFLVAGSAITLLSGKSTPSGTAVAILGCLGALLTSSLVGIVFPAHEDNPLSTLIGLLVLSSLFGLGGLAASILEVPTGLLMVAMAAISFFFVWFGVRGISADITRRRYEEVAVGS
jgi:hypothetical protein